MVTAGLIVLARDLTLKCKPEIDVNEFCYFKYVYAYVEVIVDKLKD